jgi:DNA-binding LacI/PurR family transcriptional regulator
VAVRLSDVAKRAGVSVKTVSNVVSGYAHVSPATRKRVQKALDSLGYQPNLSARSLRGGRSGVIGLAVPGLNPYFVELAGLVERAVAEAGYTLLVDQTEALHERESRVVRGIRPQLIDGLIFSPSALDGATIAKGRSATPLVLLGERVSDGSIDHVGIDNVSAAHEAVKHLIDLGRRRIAAVGALRSPSGELARMRLAGYTAALTEAGIPRKRDLIVPVQRFERIEGVSATRRLLATGIRPDAIFAFNDVLAFGVLRALYEDGIRVPDDVAVVGFDDVEEGRFSLPTLTTISPDKQQIARCAVANLMERLDGGADAPPRDVVVQHSLVQRESTLGFRPTRERPELRTKTVNHGGRARTGGGRNKNARSRGVGSARPAGRAEPA